MTRLEALKALAAKVEAGTWLDDWREIADAGLAHGSHGLSQGGDAFAAYHGSLDAALSLHNAVLPGWFRFLVRHDEKGGFANVMTDDFRGFVVIRDEGAENVTTSGASFPAWSNSPARAWLLAIISALIAMEEGQ